MKTSAPKNVTWWVALVLGVLGVLANITSLPVITAVIGFWLVVIGLALMLIATITKGL